MMEDSDQTARIRRLIGMFAGRTGMFIWKDSIYIHTCMIFL